MKIAIVTGANGNLGSKFLRTLRDLDYFVYAVDKEVGEINSEEFVESVQLDVTDEKKVSEFYLTISSLDLLVNNAGIGVFTPFEERTADEFRMVTDVNLLGTFLMAQGAIKIMKKQSFGKVVNLGSIYGVKSSDERIYGDSGRNNSEVYSITKAGVIQLTKYMAAHFGKYNVQTNCISPGGIYNGQADDFVSNYEYKTPAQKMGMPEDITNALIFLCSDNSGYVNGQNIAIDGGFLAW
jgi:3-oxoacyl-[acyl-carrier protein] reductase